MYIKQGGAVSSRNGTASALLPIVCFRRLRNQPENTNGHAAENEQGDDVGDGRDKRVRKDGGVDTDRLCKQRHTAADDLCDNDGDPERHCNGERNIPIVSVAEQ